MDLGIRGKVALVGGASAGIGFASARALAAEGARVAIVSRSKERIERAAAQIGEDTGAEILPLVVDVATPDGPARAVAATSDALGAPSILVTNTGGPPSGTFADRSEGDFARAFELTFRSVERFVRAASGAMIDAGWGRIVNLTSIAAREPHEGLLLSNSMRPAVHGLAKTLSKELGAHGITVNCVCTGFTATERLHELAAASAKRAGSTPDAVFAGWRARIPRRQLGRPAEIGDVVAFLCSERASFVNGVSLAVDGGESHSLM